MEPLHLELPGELSPILTSARPASGDDWLVDSFIRFRSRLVRAAARLIRDLEVNEADIDSDGAVNWAFCEVYRQLQCTGGQALSDKELFGLIYMKAHRTIFESHRRSRRRKRGGKGRQRTRLCSDNDEDAPHHGFRRVEAKLDDIVGREPPVVEAVAAKLDLHAFVEHLSDPRHRAIITMLMEGESIGDIAGRLHLSRRTIQRSMDEIRRLSLRFFQVPDSAEDSFAIKGCNRASRARAKKSGGESEKHLADLKPI